MIRDCGALRFTDAAAKAHAALVQRAAAVLSSYGADGEVMLADAFEGVGTDPRRMSLLLERSPTPALQRTPGSRQTILRYADGAGEAALAALLASAARPGAPIAADPESLSILALAERIAASDIPVLINGPTGTGKEVLSRFIHERSSRKDKPFIAINCAAMPEAMLEALLFGHQKGAFTGANAASEGFFRAANGGTLLLDEIAEMPLTLQAKLLRALQEGEVVPLGATQPIKVDVRVIACANRDLPLEVEEGRFRADLFYRLNVFPLALRPLNERPDDIAPLAFAMVLRHSRQAPWIADETLALLAAHSWPGNVRELENVIRRALVLAGDAPVIGPEHIVFDRTARLISEPVQAASTVADGKLSNIVQISESRAILATLDACNGSRVAAARQLGISERTLRYRLASFREAGIEVNGRAVGARR
ncbi:sigma-54-dependent Fis family transcriptional regulator [Novosphingobium sp. CECT 9465]|uniref:sigma-54 interaction domain-containing protein n=1 Tax=Novosphingobium sp. CECT 9465 TaxID=2829794 RepID=UPI001E44CFA0|nr:sigma 54-interacting transcriptional regulator [Novosphingobium sp. CECT 9465]